MFQPSLLLLAYLDPGSGSLLIQILLGVSIGAAVAVRAYWQRISYFWQTRVLGREITPLDEDEDDDDDE